MIGIPKDADSDCFPRSFIQRCTDGKNQFFHIVDPVTKCDTIGRRQQRRRGAIKIVPRGIDRPRIAAFADDPESFVNTERSAVSRLNHEELQRWILRMNPNNVKQVKLRRIDIDISPAITRNEAQQLLILYVQKTQRIALLDEAQRRRIRKLYGLHIAVPQQKRRVVNRRHMR